MLFEVLPHFHKTYGVSEELAEGGDGFVGDAAGDDETEMTHVGVYVERESVEGDPFVDADADGGHFGPVYPDAGKAFHAFAGQSVFTKHANDHFFEGAEIPPDGAAPVVEIEDGIGDELAGAVVGSVSSTIHFDNLDSFLGIAFLGEQEMFRVCIAPEGDYGGVFEQEQGIGRAVFFHRQTAETLLFKHFPVGNGPGNMNDLNLSGHDDRVM